MKEELAEVALHKVAHHGRANSASGKLLETLNPDYAVVTSDSADEGIIKSSEKRGNYVHYRRAGKPGQTISEYET